MAVQTATTLKGYFNTGDMPTEAQFVDLIDSSVNTGLLDETAHDALDHTGLTGIPAAYSLPTASTTVLGGVKVDGTSVTITDGVISSSGSGMTNPMTTAGDIIIGGTSGAPTRLAKGTDGQVLTLASGNPAWAAASGGSLLVAETVVSGSAVTSVTFGGLDGNASGGYSIYAEIVANSGLTVHLTVNDQASTTFRTQTMQAAGSVVSVPIVDGTEANFSPWIDSSGAVAMVVGDISRINGKYKGSFIANVTPSTQYFINVRGTVDITNITSIQILAQGGNTIGVGSTFCLYKRK